MREMTDGGFTPELPFDHTDEFPSVQSQHKLVEPTLPEAAQAALQSLVKELNDQQVRAWWRQNARQADDGPSEGELA